MRRGAREPASAKGFARAWVLVAILPVIPIQTAAQPAVQPPLIAQGCVGCHGQNGAGRGSIPKLAGYPREAFIAQWSAFRKNERPATIMNRVAPGYTDAEVAQLADYFSKLK